MFGNIIKQQLWVILGSVFFILLGAVIISISNQYRFEENLCWFDCVWYQSIINHGYSFHYNQQSNVAFFPLFPFVWKTLGLSFFSMALFNLICFISSLICACFVLKIPLKSTAIFCFSGMLTFFMVPYSESFFFTASVLMLVGFYKKLNGLLFAGICIAIFTRSASLVFMVAFGLMAILSHIENKQRDRVLFSLAILVSAVSTAVVFYIHYNYTGIWNGFFIAQSYWEFRLQMPHLPFLQGAWPSTLFDSAALLIGLFSLLVLTIYATQKLLRCKNRFLDFTEELLPHELFSLLYLAGCTLVVVLFLGGSLRSLGRFVFATPFYLVFITLFVTQAIKIRVNWKLLLLIGIISMLLLPINGYPEHVIQIYANSIVLGWLVFYTPVKNSLVYKIVLGVVFMWGFIQQSIALSEYIHGNWMG
jgi:hypothetical protein